MAGWRNCVAAVVLLLTVLHGAGATCPTFVAWLDKSKNRQQGFDAGYKDGFVALTVLPDRKSVVINWQLSRCVAADVPGRCVAADVPGLEMITAGIFGPARKDQDKPDKAGMLLDMGITNPLKGGAPEVMRKKIQSDDMEDILRFLREELLYVNIIARSENHTNPVGVLRGQLVVPHCLEGELSGNQPGDYYGFTNIMVSPDPDDKSVAILVQASPDTSGVKAKFYNATGASIQGVGEVEVRNEIKADAPDDEGLYYHVIYNLAQPWTALVRPGHTFKVEASKGSEMMLSGHVVKARACRLLSSVEDTLFTTAKEFGNDWLTVWSLNEQKQNPDHRRTLTPRYYAHPFEVTSGDTADAIMKRFGISERELIRSNPAIMDVQSLKIGDVLCIIPNFRMTMSGNGAKICHM